MSGHVDPIGRADPTEETDERGAICRQSVLYLAQPWRQMAALAPASCGLCRGVAARRLARPSNWEIEAGRCQRYYQAWRRAGTWGMGVGAPVKPLLTHGKVALAPYAEIA